MLMSKIEKILANMRNHHHGWSINEIKNLADRYEIDYKQPGTSHVTFRTCNGTKLTIPAHKPIKPIYVKQFIELIDALIGEKE
jgi:hypothetical protein